MHLEQRQCRDAPMVINQPRIRAVRSRDLPPLVDHFLAKLQTVAEPARTTRTLRPSLPSGIPSFPCAPESATQPDGAPPQKCTVPPTGSVLPHREGCKTPCELPKVRCTHQPVGSKRRRRVLGYLVQCRGRGRYLPACHAPVPAHTRASAWLAVHGYLVGGVFHYRICDLLRSSSSLPVHNHRARRRRASLARQPVAVIWSS